MAEHSIIVSLALYVCFGIIMVLIWCSLQGIVTITEDTIQTLPNLSIWKSSSYISHSVNITRQIHSYCFQHQIYSHDYYFWHIHVSPEAWNKPPLFPERTRPEISIKMTRFKINSQNPLDPRQKAWTAILNKNIPCYWWTKI